MKWRQALMGFLLLCFFVQSYLIYSDPKVRHISGLSPKAQTGKALFQSSNCQACHQIYGFGGLLGPDLTNITSRLPFTAFEAIVRAGPAQMPAFLFGPDATQAIYSYLVEMDRTGVSQARGKRANSLSLRDIPWFEFHLNDPR